MKKLAAVALLAVALTGCGTQTALTGAPIARTPMTAAAAQTGTRLYGAVIRGAQVLATKDLPVLTQDSDKTFREQVSLDVPDTKDNQFHGKVVVVLESINKPIAHPVKAGQKVDTFANYPLVDEKSHTFINEKNSPLWVLDFKVSG